MAENPLWSVRKGGSLPLTKDGFDTLLAGVFLELRRSGYFSEVLGWPSEEDRLFGFFDEDPELAKRFFAMHLGDPWPAGRLSTEALSQRSDDDLLTLIELLHRDAVGRRTKEGLDREIGREELRTRINPVLARRDPPLELMPNSEIVAQLSEPFARLVEQPLPPGTPKREVADRVDDAISHFRRRRATNGDRRAAIVELANVLEFLRPDVKAHMLTEDEGALFQIANGFDLRHNKRETRRAFDEPAWLAWAFYVYLASVRLTLELRRRGGPNPA